MNDKRAPAVCLVAMVLLASVDVSVRSPVAAQPADRPCAEEAAPQDDFQSEGLGLTVRELELLYGESEPGQGSIYFDFSGVDLHTDGCDLILAFPVDGSAGGDGQEFALAQGLLPADAELVGSFARGSTIRSEQASELWYSDSLAARFARLGEARGGEILILYTYQAAGMGFGPIERIEIRTLELAE